MNRIVPRIRALVVVPSRDLVLQVWIVVSYDKQAKLTFDAYTKGTDLHVGVIVGQEAHDSLHYNENDYWMGLVLSYSFTHR